MNACSTILLLLLLLIIIITIIHYSLTVEIEGFPVGVDAFAGGVGEVPETGASGGHLLLHVGAQHAEQVLPDRQLLQPQREEELQHADELLDGADLHCPMVLRVDGVHLRIPRGHGFLYNQQSVS